MFFLVFSMLFAHAQSQSSGNGTLFGTWAVTQYNYSCDANSQGQRFVGHRPVNFNTVSFTNWDGAFKAWTTDWAIMSGVYSNNGSFYASGTVGVNANDTTAQGCALTSRLSGFYNVSENTWTATLSMDYSLLCWGCLLDDDGCSYTKVLPLSSSQYLSPPAPRAVPSLLTPPLYLAELMSVWPVSVSKRCGRLTLGVTAIEFSNVNFTRIALTATTTLGKLPLRGVYNKTNNTFSASSSFTFQLGAICTAVAQVNGQVQFYENSSCAEEHNATLSWSATASMIILGACANCSQIVFPLASEPLLDCLSPTVSLSPTTAADGTGTRDLNSSTAPTSSPTETNATSRGIVNLSPPDPSFIHGIPLWAAILIIVLAFLCCLGLCACLFFSHRTKPPVKPVGTSEREQLVVVHR